MYIYFWFTTILLWLFSQHSVICFQTGSLLQQHAGSKPFDEWEADLRNPEGDLELGQGGSVYGNQPFVHLM